MNSLEKKLKVSRDRLRLITDSMPALIAYIDNERKFVFCNAEHQQWFGVSPRTIPGMSLAEVFDRRIEGALQPHIDVVLQGKQVTFEIRLQHRLKGSRICEATLIPHAVEGAIVGFCVLATDITEKKRKEVLEESKNLQLIRALKRVEASNRELEQFASVCSHDIQEPLRMIRAYVDLLAKRYGDTFDDKAATYFHYIAKGAHRMQLMVDSLLDYARLTTLNMPPSRVDMEAVVRQALNNLEPLIQKNGARITSTPLPQVAGHPIHLLRLMQNLLSNAIKFHGPSPPEIDIGAEETDQGEWLFHVRDNGIGIDVRYGSAVFDLFKRLEPTGEVAGTGIGLSLCKKIVENHDGRLWFESETGRGTTFFFTLPQAHAYQGSSWPS